MRKRVGTEGQIFTPAWIVNLILDAVGYTGQSVTGKNNGACFWGGRFFI